MGTYTFSVFEDLLKFEIEERSDLSAHSSLGNLWGRAINSAYIRYATSNRIWGLKLNYTFPELQTSTTSATSDGVAYITTPSDCLHLIHLYDQTNNLKLDAMSLKKYVGYTDRDTATSEGKPTEWVRSGGYIYLHPTPDDAYTMEIWYRKVPTVLSAADDVTAIGPEHDEIILKIAVIEMMLRLKMYEYVEPEKKELAERISSIAGIYDNEQRDRRIVTGPDPSYLDFT